MKLTRRDVVLMSDRVYHGPRVFLTWTDGEYSSGMLLQEAIGYLSNRLLTLVDLFYSERRRRIEAETKLAHYLNVRSDV